MANPFDRLGIMIVSPPAHDATGEPSRKRVAETDDDGAESNEAAAAPIPEHIVVNGLRYVAPYWIQVELCPKHQRQQQVITLLDIVRQCGLKTKHPSLAWWLQELVALRLELIIQKKHSLVTECGKKEVLRRRASPYDVIGDIPLDYQMFCLRGKYHFHEEPILDGKLQVVYEDDQYFVVDKPSGVDVLCNRDAGRVFHSLPGLLLTELGKSQIYPVHRIDNPVSGLVCCGTTIKDAKRLSRRIELGQAQKTYLARVLVTSDAAARHLLDDEHLPMVIDAPIAWDTATSAAVVMGANFVQNQGAGNTIVKAKRSKTVITKCFGKTMLFHDSASQTQPSYMALIAIQPRTGRKHQIRCHLQHVGLPIANDKKYGGIAASPSLVPFPPSAEMISCSPSSACQEQRLPAFFAGHFVDTCTHCHEGKDGDATRAKPARGVWLHSWRYEFPTLDLCFETSLPDWAKGLTAH